MTHTITAAELTEHETTGKRPVVDAAEGGRIIGWAASRAEALEQMRAAGLSATAVADDDIECWRPGTIQPVRLAAWSPVLTDETD